jgi:hypothetical protein
MPFVSATLCAQPSSSLTARAVLALTDLTGNARQGTQPADGLDYSRNATTPQTAN